MGDLCKYIKEGKVKEAESLLSKIDTIDLSGNNIGDKGIKVLAKTLENNKTIHTIDLFNNNIGVEGIKVLAKTLENNKTIHTINLSYNSIGDEGIKALAKAIKFQIGIKFI